MTKEPLCCLPETLIVDVGRMMIERDCGAIPVVDDLVARVPLGIVTDRDIVTRVIAGGFDPLGVTARDCMTSPAVTIVEDARLSDCIQLLELTQIRRVIVVGPEGDCVGIVSQADIADHASKREAGELLRAVSKPAAPAFAI